MQHFKLTKLLKKNSWHLLRHGGNHDVWVKGNQEIILPRHAEINERLARAIIKKNHLK